MCMKLSPTQRDIDYWVETFLPPKDIYYLDEPVSAGNLGTAELLTPSELLAHPEYGSLAYANTYDYEKLDLSRVKWVLVASPDWFPALPMLERAKLFRLQVQLGRGLVLGQEVLPGHAFIKMIQHAGVDGKLVLNHYLWNRLDLNLRQQTAERVARFMDGFECEPCPEDAPAWMKSRANSFIHSDGANGFGATLFAASGNPDWLEKNVSREEFRAELGALGFQQIDRDNSLSGGITVFYDGSGLERHACYQLGNGLVLNKSGQSKYQALKVSKVDQVLEGWPGFKPSSFVVEAI